LKTLFEADFCHYIFPCFDQIDLKAKVSLSAVIEQDWTLISTELPNATPEQHLLNELKETCEKAVDLFVTKWT